MLILRLVFAKIFTLMIFTEACYSLRCRSEDGPADGELKRVARSCMRKFSDVAFSQNSQQQQQQQQQHTQGRYTSTQNVMNGDDRGYNYENSEENDNHEFEDNQYYNNNNNNYNRQYTNTNSGGHNRIRYNSSNRTSNGNNNNHWNYSNHKNTLSNLALNRGNINSNNNNKGYTNNDNNNNQNNSYSDVACIVHCFFNEMHMLNNDDYPDRHKMLYILTKDIRDRELRNFYTDTIQECFRYLENQRRRNKCQFSRDLITCMMEYAKGNCDDWNEFNMLFN